MADERSNTAQKQQAPGKPFTRGDPRINRKGRPRSFDKLRDLVQSMLSEPAKDKGGNSLEIDGHIATNIEVMLRQAMREPRLLQYLLEVAYGKMPQSVDITSGGQLIQFVVTSDGSD